MTSYKSHRDLFNSNQDGEEWNEEENFELRGTPAFLLSMRLKRVIGT